MFQTAAGITIPFPEKMKEEYQVFEKRIQFHVSFQKLGAMLEAFLARLEEPLFFVLQLPLTRQEEEALGAKTGQCLTGSPHDKICYLDGQSKERIRAILRQYGELLLNDGISRFGIASHVTHDEMFIMKYKLVDIYCGDPSKYFDLMEQYGLIPTGKLLTVWDTFSRKTPGQARCIEMNGITVYEVYDALVKLGMYEAKIIDG